MFVCPECGTGFDGGGYCPEHGTALVDGATDGLLGYRIEPYRIARLLGVGGMGRVYLGVHPDIGSRVAIKVLSADRIMDTHLVHRFFDEARAVNVIRHEAIVNVLDLSTLPDGRPYIVMEYLDGAPMSSVIRRGPAPLGGLARAMSEVLGALQAAHDKGIVHRDLKPDNIFLSPNGRPKVLDFGIAKLIPELGGSTDPTRTGSLLGTPHYMSPEQTLSRPVDARADVYAAGVILFEAATGRRPFDSDSLFDLMRQHLEEPPPPPRSLRPDMPVPFEQVILQALAKSPEDRFQSARALSEALTAACRSLPADAWEPLRGTAGANPGPAMPSPTPQHTPSSELVPHLPTPTPRGLTDRRPASTDEAFAPTVAAQPGEPRKLPSWLAPVVAATVAAATATVAVLLLTNKDDAASTEPTAAADTAIADAGAAVVAADAASLAVVAAAPVPDAAAPAAARVTDPPARPRPGRKPPPPPKPDAGAKAADRSSEEQRDSAIPSKPSTKGFDPARFDVSGYLKTANRRAKRHWSDAVFVRVDAEGVFADGYADLTLDDSFSVLYRFISPSRAKGDPDAPIGAPKKVTCVYYVNVTEKGVSAWEVPNWDCDDYTPIPLPKCSVKQVWKKAMRDGAPKQRAVADIGMWAGRNGVARWSFSVKEHFSSWIDDDC